MPESCPHRWVLETSGYSTWGLCSICGGRKFFRGGMPGSYFQKGGLYWEEEDNRRKSRALRSQGELLG